MYVYRTHVVYTPSVWISASHRHAGLYVCVCTQAKQREHILMSRQPCQQHLLHRWQSLSTFIVSSPAFNVLRALLCSSRLGWGILTTASFTTLVLQNGSLEEANHLPLDVRCSKWWSQGELKVCLIPEPGLWKLHSPATSYEGARSQGPTLWIPRGQLAMSPKQQTDVPVKSHDQACFPITSFLFSSTPWSLMGNTQRCPAAEHIILSSFSSLVFPPDVFFFNSCFFVPISLHLSPELFLNVYLLLNYHW